MKKNLSRDLLNKSSHNSNRITSFEKILKIKNISKRNLIRGKLSKNHLSDKDIQEIREGNIYLDNLIIGGIVKGENGLSSKQKTVQKPTSASIYKISSLKPLEYQNELLYTIGYINERKKTSLTCLDLILKLSPLESLPNKDALEFINELAENFGASNYLSYKLSYIKSSRIIDENSQRIIDKIEENIFHREAPGFHFSALENLSSKISIFLVAKRRMAGLKGRIGSNFRESFSLSNFIPTPIDRQDIAPFLLRSTENSLIDSIHALIIIKNLNDSYPELDRLISNFLNHDILQKIEIICSRNEDFNFERILTTHYHSQNPDSTRSLDFYRISSAFLERKELCKYRNEIDTIIGRRLLNEAIFYPPIKQDSLSSKEALFQSSGIFNIDSRENSIGSTDSFYRTFLFLNFISSRSNMLSFNKEEIKFIFENTMGLEYFLTENEVRSLYLTAPNPSKGLIAVLSLSLYRSKSADPDIDFEFRDKFIQYVNQQHTGSIENFINYLLDGTPEVANYIVGSLDESTLEKMYTLVESSSKASDIRQAILRAVGIKLNRIEYLIEADAIDTRLKISRLRGYFDASRMYVDSVAMKKWLDSNPSVFTEQYKDQYPKTIAKLSKLKAKSNANDRTQDLVVVEYLATDVYLVTQIAKDAFEEFCLNNEFGIQSYLGRRIRHNTLHGVMTETVDTIWQKQEHTALMVNRNFRKSWEEWLDSYKGIVERLRKEQLQFKTASSLFNYHIDESDPLTQRNITDLASSLRSSAGMELLNDLVVGFCWKQISPQLENASRFIKTTLLNEAINNINYFLGKFHGNDEERFKHELLEAVNEVFRKVASWFRVPQTGFIPATIEEICGIIAIDLNRPVGGLTLLGNAINKKFTGISVHRIYDCLAVLMQNAYKHGDPAQPIIINATSIEIIGAPAENLSIIVKSKTSRIQFTKSVERIKKSINSSENGADMVNEGYSGIKKLKFITKLNEGAHTVIFDKDEAIGEIQIGFSLKCERLAEDQE